MVNRSLRIGARPKGRLRRRATLIAWVAVLTTTGVLDVMLLGDDPVWSRLPLILALGLLAGLGLGVGVALAWDSFAERLKGASDVAAATGLPVLGASGPDDTDRSIVTGSRPIERSKEYGQLLSTLRASRGGCLLVTSPTNRSGRTSVAIDLAASIAARGRRVVLLSADPRGERAEQVLGLRQRPGLTEVLDGSASLDSALQESGVERLSVLASGAPPGRAFTGHDVDDLAPLLDWLAKRVDLVVIDAPPVLEGLATVLLAQEADLVLVAVDTRQDARSDATLAMSYLGHVEDRLIGCVATSSGPRRSGPASSLPARSDVPSEERPRGAHHWAGAIATAVTAAMVISAVWWWSHDGPTDAQQDAEAAPDVSSSTTAPPWRPAVESAVEECRATWDAQSAPLDAAAGTLNQWQTHIDAMNQLVAGEITLDQANAFWERTRVRAGEKVRKFLGSDDRYTSGQHACRTPEAARQAGADLPVLSACQDAITRRYATLRAARVTVETWHHHVMDMNRLRAGKMSPARAVQQWRKYWKQGAAELTAYQSRLRQTDGTSC